MSPFPAPATRQSGAALIALAAILVLGLSWMMVSALGNASQRTTSNREHNARVLAEAKAALAAWVAVNALDNTEDNPGRLPCPQAWGDVGNAAIEGRAASNCSAPAAGWLPWRTLGLPKLFDASGNQLWYVVSPGWHRPNSTATLTINTNTAAGLLLDGQAAVALIIATGPALNIAPNANQLAAGCLARSQSQALSLPAIAPNPLDFLECQNGSTADNVFTALVVDNATNAVFNDQVLAVTTADILPGLEAAISKRIERDIVPQLQNVFAGPSWGLTAGSRLYPFAAPFANPGPGAGTSNFAGVDGVYQGLLPFNQIDNCTAAASNPRCAPGTAFVAFSGSPDAYDAGGYGYIQAQSCSWPNFPALDVRECLGEYHENDTYPWQTGMRIEMQATFTNVAMGLRTLDTTRMTVEARDNGTTTWLAQAIGTPTVTMNSNGSATITFGATLPNIDGMGWGTYAEYRVRIERQVISDHALLDPTNATTGWFVRNEWFRVLYYAAAASTTADGALPGAGCTTDGTCLRLMTWPSTTPEWNKRALLVLAGGSLANPPLARPNGTLTDHLELQNGDLGTLYERRPVSRVTPFNDRVIVVDANP